MRKLTSLLLILFFFQTGSGQQAELDSDLIALKAHPQQDVLRLRLLNNASFLYQTISPANGLKSADEAIALANTINKPDQLAIAYKYKGMNYAATGQQLEALEMYGLAMETFKKLRLSSQMASVYNAMGVAHKSQSDNYQAIKCYINALKIFETHENKDGIATTYNNISLIYNNMGNHSKALVYQEKAYELFKQMGNETGSVNALGNAAASYNSLGNRQKALQFYQQALAISKRIGYQRGIGNTSLNIGTIYSWQNQFMDALYYFKTGLSVITRMGDDYNKAFLLCEIGRIYAKLPDSILTFNNVSPSQRYNVVLKFLRESLAFANKTHNGAVQASVWQLVSELYEKTFQFANALDALKKFASLKDSMSNNSMKQQILSLELQYEYEKKEAVLNTEHASELKQQKTTRNFILGSSSLILLSGILLFFSYKRHRDVNSKRKDAELKAHIADTEMKVMRLQMNPHFIYNSLNSISDYIMKNNPVEADAYLTKFAKVMRMTLDNSEKKAISLEDDLKTLELYLELEAKRSNNKFTYEIKVACDIDQENTLVPPMILQPFVENSIWHGISKKEGQGHIIIDIKKENEMLYCLIDDNGVGRQAKIDNEPIYGKTSLGMKITQARIDILNRLKGSNAAVVLIDKPQGLSVELKLPLETAF